MYVENFFTLSDSFKKHLHSLTPIYGYGMFGPIVYYKNYSRLMGDGRQEQWADTVSRNIEGVFSIRKDWYLKNNIYWNESEWTKYAEAMALSQFRMNWTPPGRGLYQMGNHIVYERGAMCLYNCAYTDIGVNWVDDLCWLMDSSMCGVGVGFGAKDIPLTIHCPQDEYPYVIGDSREGWVDSVRALLTAYNEPGHSLPKFDYSRIRKEGSLIRGFGGTASGPAPLKKLHNDINVLMSVAHEHNSVRIFTDLANMIGCCVVAGNIRRSAEIALGRFDSDFIDYKDYDKYPEREEFGWMSNNSIILETDDDFQRLDEIAMRVIKNGEPGYINYRNFPRGRLGHDDNIGMDNAVGINPCGEIPLENREVCNVADVIPTRCFDSKTYLKACEYAAFYTSTVALLPTHHQSTNQIVLKNRRIGVSMIDYVGWKEQQGQNKVIRHMRDGYTRIRECNSFLAQEAGVRDSLRVTTVKPGGSTTKVIGRTPGIGHPNYQYMLRRIRVQRGTPIEVVLDNAGVPSEPCDLQPDFTRVFEVPIYMGENRTVKEVSLWEQAMNLVTVQREWADNAVSNTLVFKQNEEHIVEHVLSAIAPLTKSVSLLKYYDSTHASSYKQMPEEEITPAEYNKRINNIREIDWSKFNGSDGVDERYCTGDTCVRA